VLRYKSKGCKKKAEITVFLSLLLSIICLLILAVFKSARWQSEKLLAEAVTDCSIKSAFSEYDVKIFEKYGLLYINTEYHGETGGDISFSDHVSAYIKESLLNTSHSTLFCLNLKSITVLSSEYASDNLDYLSNELSSDEYISFCEENNIYMLLYMAEIETIFETADGKEIRVVKSYSY